MGTKFCLTFALKESIEDDPIDALSVREDPMHPFYHDILLDRDGTVIEDRHYLHDPDQIRFLPGALPGLQALVRAGCRLFVVTNQSGIGRGYFSRDDYDNVERRLDHLLARHGVVLSASAYCPHSPSDTCSCRKPAPGLVQTLIEHHGLQPRRSIVIGDKKSDIRLAETAGLGGGILVATGKGRQEAEHLGCPPLGEEAYLECEQSPAGAPVLFARDLEAAAEWILKAPPAA